MLQPMPKSLSPEISNRRAQWEATFRKYQSRSQSSRCFVQRKGNRDLWDNPFQLDFSLAAQLSMSSRTKSQEVNKSGGKESAEGAFKLLLSVVNQTFCSWTPISSLALKGIFLILPKCKRYRLQQQGTQIKQSSIKSADVWQRIEKCGNREDWVGLLLSFSMILFTKLS